MSRSAQSTLFGGLQPVHQFTSWDRPEISSLGLAWCETCCCRPAEPFTRLRVQPAAEREFRYTLHRACSEWEQWLKMELIHTTSMHYSHTTGCVCVYVCMRLRFFFLSFLLPLSSDALPSLYSTESNFWSPVEVVFSHKCICIHIYCTYWQPSLSICAGYI